MIFFAGPDCRHGIKGEATRTVAGHGEEKETFATNMLPHASKINGDVKVCSLSFGILFREMLARWLQCKRL